MKYFIISLFGFSAFCISSCGTQLKNFNGNEPPQSLLKEDIIVDVESHDLNGPKIKTGGLDLSTILGAGVGVGVDIAKTIIDNRQQSFTATYTGSFTGTPLIDHATLTPEEITITRKTFTDQASGIDASVIKLKVDNKTLDKGVFRLKMDSLLLKYTKARLKRNNSKCKTVDLSIDTKITANYVDTDKDGVKTFHQVVLGESTIILSSIGISSSAIGFGDDNKYYSDWYQMITPANMPKNEQLGVYTVNITVKEANPCSLNSTQLNDFLKNNGSDISSLLQSFLPAKSN